MFIYQVTEKYKINDKTKEKKYEVKFIDDMYYVKEVNGFETKNITFNKLFHKKQIVILIALIILFLILSFKKILFRCKKFNI